MKKAAFIFLLASQACGTALAQTTSSVSGPEISTGARDVEYRVAAAFGETVDDAAFAHRLHVQHAVSDQLRWRLRAAWRDPEGGDLDLDHLQAELHWQLVERTPGGFSSGLRFTARSALRDGRADEIGTSWIQQWVFQDGWRVRALVSLDREVGPEARDDWIVETRASVYRSLESGLSLGVESFNDFGGLEEGFGGFNDQSHQIGPVLSGDLAGGVDWSAGILFGLSDGADDQDLMLRLSRPL